MACIHTNFSIYYISEKEDGLIQSANLTILSLN